MTLLHPIRCSVPARHSLATRAIALAVVGLFCAQLSRVYLVIPADAFICHAAEHSHDTEAPAGHHHDHDAHHEGGEGQEISALAHDDDGTYIQHCKDTLDGFGLTPAQPFGVPVTFAVPMPQAADQVFAREAAPELENFVRPPSPPPRSLS